VTLFSTLAKPSWRMQLICDSTDQSGASGRNLETSLRRAVAGALQHAKVGAPRAHGLAVLVGHDP